MEIDSLQETVQFGESSLSLSELQISGSIENSIKKAIIKKWKDMRIDGYPSHLLSLFDRITFPEQKNVTTLIIASIVINESHGKITNKVISEAISRFSGTVNYEGIRPHDILRYIRYLMSL